MDATDNGVLVTQYYGCWVVDFYERSRTHLALQKDAPVSRPVSPSITGRIIAIPQVHGPHHRYEDRVINSIIHSCERRYAVATALRRNSRFPSWLVGKPCSRQTKSPTNRCHTCSMDSRSSFQQRQQDASTVTPGSNASEVSRTTPAIALVPCALAGADARSTHAHHAVARSVEATRRHRVRSATRPRLSVELSTVPAFIVAPFPLLSMARRGGLFTATARLGSTVGLPATDAVALQTGVNRHRFSELNALPFSQREA